MMLLKSHYQMVHCEDRCVSSNIVLFLLLTHFTGAQSQVFGPRQLVMATVGDDVVLPCQLDPPQDAVSMTIEWGRPDLNPRFVHVWYGRRDLLIDQNEAFKGRTSLSTNMMNHGDVSLRLSTVKISDNGKYRCYVSKLKREHFVDLLVGSASSPVITSAGIHEVTGGLDLRCESGGWYPKPELLWLDSEGDLLPAGPPETLRGPDDLYTVSSRVTVEKRSNITCRVQQKETNQTRDIHFLVPDKKSFSCSTPATATYLSVILVGGFILTLVALYYIYKMRKKHAVLQRKCQRMLKRDQDKLEEVKRQLQVQRDQLIKQLDEVETEMENNKEELQSVEMKISQGQEDNLKELVREKEKLQDAQWKLKEIKNNYKRMKLNIEGCLEVVVLPYIR